jgi:hypothetical protein
VNARNELMLVNGMILLRLHNIYHRSAMPSSVLDCFCKGAAASTAGGVVLLTLLAAPPAAARLVRLKLPNSW